MSDANLQAIYKNLHALAKNLHALCRQVRSSVELHQEHFHNPIAIQGKGCQITESGL
jgi:hypothetical protein